MLLNTVHISRIWRAIGVLLIAIAGIASTIASSSGGSGGSPPMASITFPSPGFETEDDVITVTGTASDETGVFRVQVNGVDATSSDRFATWEAVVSLVEGPNTLTVRTVDTLGMADRNAAQVDVILTSAPPLATVAFPPLDSFSDADSVTVTGTATDRSGVASVTVNDVDATPTGPGNSFDTWEVVVPLTMGIVNTLTVSTEDSVGFGDPAAAEVRVHVAADVSGSGVTFGNGYGIALVGNLAYIVDFDTDQLVQVDINNGDKVIISDAATATGIGPALSGPNGIALIDGGTSVLVSNYVTDELLSVNLSTGNRTRVSSLSANVGGGPTLFGPSGIGVAVADALALVSNLAADEVMSVDVVNGDREILSAFGTKGAGPAFLQPDGIAMESSSRAIVVDTLLGAVFAVDVGSGDRTVISGAETPGADPIGSGPLFSSSDPNADVNPPVGITLYRGNERALVTVPDTNLLMSVTMSNGFRSKFSDAAIDVGAGPAFFAPVGIALDIANNRAVVSGGNLVVVEMSSGDRVIVGPVQ